MGNRQGRIFPYTSNIGQSFADVGRGVRPFERLYAFDTPLLVQCSSNRNHSKEGRHEATVEISSTWKRDLGSSLSVCACGFVGGKSSKLWGGR